MFTFRADDCGVHGGVLLELHLDLRHLGLPLRLRRPRSPLQVHHPQPLEGPQRARTRIQLQLINDSLKAFTVQY